MRPSKILTRATLPGVVAKIRRAKKRIAFTNGTFDILHLGHVTYLQKAKATADVLIVGVNTDRSVKTYKDPTRPINPQNDRLQVLAALACIDYVILFDDPTPLKLILAVRPDILVKGADWALKDIAGAKEVLSWGGKVRRIKLVAGRSSTRIIRALKLA
ncbi:MAG TPA: D-glycero-beta-D-manno-heptose 1-phosphate adenylyltransferase [Candidatus Omnitrophota bacterium]|nr:D-glycero-beta-D-manno-heptose 1-phosphate adenylyltransferase [Candidatus Omnitrophota bacterium]